MIVRREGVKDELSYSCSSSSFKEDKENACWKGDGYFGRQQELNVAKNVEFLVASRSQWFQTKEELQFGRCFHRCNSKDSKVSLNVITMPVKSEEEENDTNRIV